MSSIKNIQQRVRSSSKGARMRFHATTRRVSGCVALVTALVACMLHAAREPGLHGIPVSVALCESDESAGSHASRPCLCQGPHNLGLDQTGSGWCGRFFHFTA